MDKTLKYISMTVFSVVVLCIGVMLILICTMQDLLTNNQNDEICLPSENELLKCGATTNVLPNYLDKSISKIYVELKREDKKRQQKFLEDNIVHLSKLDRSIWEAKPAARIIGKEQHVIRKVKKCAEMEPLTNYEWTYGGEFHHTKGFLKHGVRYRNGRLVVPVDGTYFLYSLIDFFEQCDPSTGKPSIKDVNEPITHAIYKFNILKKSETVIISNVRPHQISTNMYYNSYSSYISTIAFLKAGDEISIKVSNITYIRYTKDNSFGLNML